MLLLGRKTAREKIATFLDMLARRSQLITPKGAGTAPAAALHLPMTRDQIANYLGLTLETVSRQFSALKREGIIDVPDRRSVIVINIDLLQNATGDDADGGVVA
jgi:CRP/FNR family transcriptional regulator